MVEQPIRNRQVASSTLALGSKFLLKLPGWPVQLVRSAAVGCQVT